MNSNEFKCGGVTPQSVGGARIIAGVNSSFDISAKDSYDVQYFHGGGMFRIHVPVMKLGASLA